ncbi:MAG: TVP38/TMEM64 family protein [Nitrospirae bacterium]|nr:TVP38/TMEM64 family protein [Nitrospirota bacterium]
MKNLKFTILILLIISTIVLLKFTDLGTKLTPDSIRAFILSFGALAPIVYIAIYSIAPVFMIPGTFISFIAGVAFGGFYGTIYTVIGATFGASAAFLTSRHLGRDFIEGLLKGRLKIFDEGAERHGFKAVLFVRLIPLFPFNMVNYGAGLSKIKFKDFFLATFVGIIPGTFAYVNLGNSITDIRSWRFVLAIAFLLLLVFVPVIYKRFKTS